MFYLIVLFSFALVQLTVQKSTPADASYTAAVVEYHPSKQTDDDLALLENARNYIEIILSSETKSADILVFPESTLNEPTTAVKLPKLGEKVIPCNSEEYSAVVKNISCAARQTEKYVVIGVYIERDCKEEAVAYNDTRPCTRDNVNIYNAAVAFDKTGEVVAIYRKFNLYVSETDIRRTLLPDVAIFDTDFGVKFGLFICFDMKFDSPVSDLISQNVQNFVFPTYWFAELPYYTGVQTQQGFAYAHQVNLLAAGASKTVPGGSDVLNTGSGIYSGRFGALKAFTAINSPTTKILIAEVPKKPADHPSNMTMPEESDNSVLLPGPKLLKADLTEYNVKFLDFDTNSTQAGHLCQGSLCCDYNIRASTNNSFSQKALTYYSYVVGVFDGIRKFGNATVTVVLGGTKSCSVIACTNAKDFQTCGQRFLFDLSEHRKYTIEHIRLVATMDISESILIMPNTVRNSNLLPLQTNDFFYKEVRNESRQSTKIEMELLKPQSGLLTFAILGRDYTKDKWLTNSSSALTGCNLLISITLTTLIYNLNKFY